MFGWIEKLWRTPKAPSQNPTTVMPVQINISALAQSHIEAERALMAIAAMVNDYDARNGEVEDDFPANAVMLLRALQGTVGKLVEASKSEAALRAATQKGGTA